MASSPISKRAEGSWGYRTQYPFGDLGFPDLRLLPPVSIFAEKPGKTASNPVIPGYKIVILLYLILYTHKRYIMFHPRLSGGEALIRESVGIIVKKSRFSAQLTNKRILLVEESQDAIIDPGVREVACTDVLGAERGSDEEGSPTMIVSVASPAGEIKKLVIHFTEDGDSRAAERDQWIRELRDAVLGLHATKEPLSTEAGHEAIRMPPAYAERPISEEVHVPAPEPKRQEEPAVIVVEPSAAPASVVQDIPVQKDTPIESADAGRCDACGAELLLGSRYCHSCGYKLRTRGAESTTKSVSLAEFGNHDEKPVKKPVHRETIEPDLPLAESRGPADEGKPGSLFSTFRGMVIRPSAAYQGCRGTGTGRAAIYFLSVILLFAVVNAGVVSFAATRHLPGRLPDVPVIGAGAGVFLVVLVGLMLLMLAGVILESILLHVGVLIAGGRAGAGSTLRACMYASTPYAVAGLIPGFGLIIAGFWRFILQIVGIRELHRISTFRALLAVIIPIIIIIALTLSLIHASGTAAALYAGMARGINAVRMVL